MLILRFLHLAGAAIAVGAALAAYVAARVASREREPRSADAVVAALFRLFNYGLLTVLLSGIGAIVVSPVPVPLQMKAGWLHAMMGALVAAGAIAGIAGKRSRLLAEGDAEDPARARNALSMLAIAGFALTMVGIAAGAFRF